MNYSVQKNNRTSQIFNVLREYIESSKKESVLEKDFN